METNKLKALLTALNSGSLMRAAETLGYTSSGLTHMMNSLEQELQVKLLDRAPSGVTATEECRRLMPAFTKLLRDEEELFNELEMMRQQKNRLIRLGTFTSGSRKLVPRLIKEYTARHRDASFQLFVGGKEEVARWLADGEIDAAISSRVRGQKFDFIPILHDQFFAILPTSHPKSRNKYIQMEDLEGETLLVSSFGTDFDFEQEINRRGIKVKLMSMPVDDPAMLSMVSCGLGVSILSQLMVEGYDEDVAIIPLEPREERILGIALSKKQKPDRYIRDLIVLTRKLFATPEDQNKNPIISSR